MDNVINNSSHFIIRLLKARSAVTGVFGKGKRRPKDIFHFIVFGSALNYRSCLLYTSPSPRDRQKSRMPSSA